MVTLFHGPKTWGFRQVEGFERLFLHLLPAATSVEGHDQARRRLLPGLFTGVDLPEGESEAMQDWEEYVQPDLAKKFSDELVVVVNDLRRLEEKRKAADERDGSAVESDKDGTLNDGDEPDEPGWLEDTFFPEGDGEVESGEENEGLGEDEEDFWDDDDGEDLDEEEEDDDEEQIAPDLEIPHSHADAWASVLNQARLVMHEKSGVAELDPDDVFANTDEINGEVFGFLQYQFYTLLLDWLVDRMWEE